MTIINEAFINALLADATYALTENGLNGLAGNDLFDFLKNRMTPELAQYVVDNFTVVTHMETSDKSLFETGFDATIWKDKNGKLYLSTTGTQGGTEDPNGWNDFITDIDLSIGNGIPSSQVVDMINWWFRITTPVGHMAKQIEFEEPLIRWTDVIGPLGTVIQQFMPDTYEFTDSVPGEGIDVLMSGAVHISTNGHSLGGNLAATFALLFNDSTKGIFIDAVNTYNSAGYNWNADASFANLRQLIPMGDGSYGYTHNNYFAENGPEVTTREWLNTQLGNRIGLNQEFTTTTEPTTDISDVLIHLLPQVANHSMYKQTDLLALGDLLATLDPSLTIESLNKMMGLASNVVTDGYLETVDSRYEFVLDSLRKLLGVFDNVPLNGLFVSQTDISDNGDSHPGRVEFHQNIADLRDLFTNDQNIKNLIGFFKIVDIDVNPDSAKDKFGQFLAYYYGTTFALEHLTDSQLETLAPALYQDWLHDKTLTNTERAEGKANFSNEWYQDRSNFLSLLIDRNQYDVMSNESINQNSEDAYYYNSVGGFNNSQQLFTGTVTEENFNDNPTVNRIIFGSKNDNAIPGAFQYGSDGNDRIYGLAGNDNLQGRKGNDLLDGGADDDTLNGGEGNDILKGGTGTDTYIFDTNFGKDQIIDADGKGIIIINGITLGTLKLVEGTDIIYRDSIDAPKFEIIKINNGTTTDLLITALGSSGGQILVRDWHETAGSNLGLTLDNTVEASTFTPETITGNATNNALSVYNLRDTDPTKSITAVEATLIDGKEGNDIIMGMADSRDHLIGGEGNDIISSGFTTDNSNNLLTGFSQVEKDLLEGGAGQDFMFASVNGSVAHGGSENDVLMGGVFSTFKINPQSVYGGQSAHGAITRDQIYADILSYLNFSFTITDTDPTTISDDKLNVSLSYFNNFSSQYQEYTGAASGAQFIAKRDSNPVTTDNGSLNFSISGKYSITYDFSRNAGLTPAGSANPVPVEFQLSQYQLSDPADAEKLASYKGVNLYGDEGRDFIVGSVFADYLSGGDDGDFIYGGYGHDVIDGGKGDDLLNGDGGKDIISGGEGNDSMFGGDDDDQLYGGDGDDKLTGGIGKDYLVGGAGKDYYWGGGDDDIIVISKEDGSVYGEGGNDLFIINDVAYTESQVNQNNSSPNVSPYLVGTQNGLSIYSITIDDSEGDNTIALVGSNISSITAYAQDNDVILSTGDTSIFLVDALQHTTGQIATGESAEAIEQNQFTQQININDFLVDAISNSVNVTAQNANTEIVGGRVNDVLTANIGGSQLRGGKGDDQLNGDIGNDIYVYSLNDGNDSITEKGGNNTIKFAATITADMVDVKRVDDQLQLHISNGQIIRVNNMFDVNGAVVQANAIQKIQFADGNVWDQTQLLQEIIKPRNFTGTDNAETLIGADGNDTLTGKKGNDLLQGGLGDDTYQFSATDGKDVISDAQGSDRIVFDSSVSESNIIVRRDTQNSLLINIVDPLLASPLPGGGTFITINNAVNANGTLNSNAIESIQFTSGNVWDSAKIESEIAKGLSLTQTGTNNNDTLKGDNANGIFIGNQGNDTLLGGTANDIYHYALGDGNDVIQDTAGVDKILFTNITDPSTVKVERNGSDLTLTPVDGSVITVKNYFIPKAENIVDANITAIIDQLQNRWLAQTEKLIETHYGLQATGQIHLSFVSNVDSPEAAHIALEYVSGNQTASKITLEIDLTDFANAVSNANGSGPLYFDRIIAHEMVHALMGSQMDMTQLPPWFKEGTAEFIHGADERVNSDIPFLNLGQNFVGLFHNATIVNPSMSGGYSVSYIAVKFLDKEIRDGGGTGIKDVFNQLKTGKTFDQALAAISAAYPALQSLWTNLTSFENHFKAVGFSQYQSLLNLNDTDTGSVAGSDYGNAALTAENIIADVNIGAPSNIQLIVPDTYIASPQINGAIETIEFANGVVWDQSQVLAEIQKAADLTFNRAFIGTTSNDVITATDGNNIITGLAGNDQLNGLAGNDTYVYNLGDGNDTIVDTSGSDVIQFANGINANEVFIQRYQVNHLQVKLKDGSIVTVQNAFDASGNFTANAIENITFADNITWNQSQILIEIQKAADLIFNRSFTGTTSNDVITATDGNNVITGLAGNDQLNGLAGNDTYVYNLGDGNDTIVDTSGTDEIRFGNGINTNEVTIQKYQTNHLQIILKNGSTITVQNAFNASGNFTANAIENITFADNTNWNQSQILIEIQKAADLIFNRSFTGTASNDVITATAGNNIITGLAGNDQLNGLAGNDTYVYNLGDGNDTIVDTSGSDVIQFANGINANEVSIQKYQNNHLQIILKDGSAVTVQNAFDASGNFTANAIENITFADNTIWNQSDILVEIQKAADLILNRAFTGTTSNDVITATDGNNLITGLAGNDQLNGLAGNDTYVYNLGDGNDTIVDTSGADVIQFANGINANEVSIQKYQTNHLQIILKDGSTVTVQNALDASGNFTANAIELIQFSDNTQWDLNRIQQEMIKNQGKLLIGTDNSDRLVGANFNDILIGGGGIDTLEGGLGDDIYVININDGYDTIRDDGGTDTIQFGVGINPDDVMVAALNNKLYFFTKNGQFVDVDLAHGESQSNSNYGIEKVDFSNGISWAAAAIQQKIIDTKPILDVLVPDVGNVTTVRASQVNSYLNGIGAFSIWGNGGNDTITAEQGTKEFRGGLGSNTYLITPGRKIIVGFSLAEDKIIFSDGTNLENIRVSIGTKYIASENVYTISLMSADGKTQVDISGVVPGFASRYVYDSVSLNRPILSFLNGDSWSMNDIILHTFQGTSLADTVIGFGSDDVISPGDGNDTIYGGYGNDTLIGGNGNDTIYANGTADNMFAGGDADILIGGIGDDKLYGAGGDTYIYNLGDGNDAIYNNNGDWPLSINLSPDLSVLKLGIGINPQDVSIRGDASDLFIDLPQGQTITIKSGLMGSEIDPFHIVQNIVFSNGVVWTPLDITNMLSFNTDQNTPSLVRDFFFNANSSIVQGIAEVGSEIIIKNADNSQILGTGYADDVKGQFTIHLTDPLAHNEVINVYAMDEIGKLSTANRVNAPAVTAPTASFNAEGTVISGVAEKGSKVFARYSIYSLGIVTADVSTGAYTIQLSSPLINDELVDVTSINSEDEYSIVRSINAPDLIAPSQPTAIFASEGTTISGFAQASNVIVKNASNIQIGTATVNAMTGAYMVILATRLINAEIVTVTAQDIAGNISTALSITAPDLTMQVPDLIAPDIPTAVFDSLGKSIIGVAEAGSTIIVRNASGIQIGAVNTATGVYRVSLTTTLMNSETVNVTAQDLVGNISSVRSITVPNLTAPNIAFAIFDELGTTISGVAQVGSTVIVKDASNTQIGTATANAITGAYTITLGTALINKQLVSVTAKDAAGNISSVRSITAPDFTAPDVPTATFDEAGTTISGVAEVGSSVIVKNSSNTQIGTATANATTGVYTITLVTALTNNELVSVTATDAVGNTSETLTIVAPESVEDLTAPLQPTAIFSPAGKYLYGEAEVGSTVVVRNVEDEVIASAVTPAWGWYNIELDSSLKNSERVTVTAIDAAGNVSSSFQLNAPAADEGLRASYYGYNRGENDAAGLSDLTQVMSVISNNLPDAEFVSTYIGYSDQASAPDAGVDLIEFLGEDVYSLNTLPAPYDESIIRFYGDLQLDAGTYNFSVHADDGYSIKVDGMVVALFTDNHVAEWREHQEFSLGEGRHSIEIVYWDTGADRTFIVNLINENSGYIDLEHRMFHGSSSILDLIAPSQPTASFDSQGKIISGVAEAGSIVIVKNALDTEIGSATADSSTGNYIITLATALTNQEAVEVTARDAAGNLSPAAIIVAPIVTAPNPTSVIIEAENYSSMSGVQNESSSDIGSGQNVGYIEAGDWMAYNNSTFNVPANSRYKVTYRVASLNGGGRLTLKELNSDSSLGSITVPKTNGWQNWVDVTQEITLSGGDHTFKLAADIGGFNVNWFKLEPVAGAVLDTIPPVQPTAVFDSLGKIISGIAEAGSTVVVKNASNIQIGTTTADAATGAYSATLATALINKELINVTAQDAAGNISAVQTIIAPDKTAPVVPTAAFDVAGKIITGIAEIGSTVIVKNSSGLQIGTATADATTGDYIVTLATALINKETVNVTAKDAVGNISTARTINAPDINLPNETPVTIQAENYSSMSGVQKENTSDVGAGQNVGYIDAGDWMAYNTTFSVPTEGRYKVTYRVASLNGGGRLTLKELSSDSSLGSITVPKTNGWQNWVDVTQEITLSGGNHTFKLAADIGGFNVNWFKLEPLDSVVPSVPNLTSTVIQAENYMSMSGIQNENTSDVGGGQNVGYIEAGDWMAYSDTFSVPTEGRYKVTYRVASLNGGGRLSLKELSSGSTLGSITVPKTNDWQNWVDVTQEITLSSGDHNFKLAADIGGFNVNWFKLEPVESVARVIDSDVRVNQLIQAMASFAPASGVETQVLSGLDNSANHLIAVGQ